MSRFPTSRIRASRALDRSAAGLTRPAVPREVEELPDRLGHPRPVHRGRCRSGKDHGQRRQRPLPVVRGVGDELGAGRPGPTCDGGREQPDTRVRGPKGGEARPRARRVPTGTNTVPSVKVPGQ